MKRFGAYILAADPTWLEMSVCAYYPYMHKIVVSYDVLGKGWTGAPIPVQRCLDVLRSLDSEGKMRFAGGNYSSEGVDPMHNDTLQRSAALELASDGVDWVLQIDTDEWLPSPEALFRAVDRAETLGLSGVEWPMRVLYRQVSKGRTVEVCASDGGDHFEYIAPIAVRSGTRLIHSRRIRGGVLRAVVCGDTRSAQLRRAPQPGEVREELLAAEETIIHNSWARERSELRRKLSSWSHASAKMWAYYWLRWLPAVWLWPWMRNIHPIYGSVWPALRVCARLPQLARDGEPRS